MAKIAKVQPLVLEALENKPATRKDDYLLALEVFKHFVPTDFSINDAFKNHVALGLPSFASIVRIRRKLQIQHPHLVDPVAKAVRDKEEAEFKAYALNNAN